MGEVSDTSKALQAEDEEHRRRAEIRRQAEADLAAFNGKRKQEIDARREKNRAEQAAREAGGYVAGGPPAAAPFAATDLGAAAGLQALMGSLAGSGSGGMEGMIKAALANPAVAAAVQQAATSQPRPSETLQTAAQSGLAVRVREVTTAEESSGAFRRVVLRPATGGASGPLPFKEVESLVAAKFATNRRLDGSEVGLRPLVSLVRVADGLQVGDDEDVEELRDGDELQATFAQPHIT